MPHSIQGPLHPINRNKCIDWNNCGVLVYACHNSVVIVDGSTFRRIQTIEYHTSAVNNICWSPFYLANNEKLKEGTKIASSDIGGEIIITEVVSGNKRAQFSHLNHSVLAILWYAWKNSPCDFLLALHGGNTLILWNATSGDKVWMHTYTHNLFDMALDPFNIKHLTFSSAGSSLLLVRDVHLTTQPLSNGYIASLADDCSKTSSIQQVSYHRAYRNSLFVLSHAQLFLFDTELCATLFKLNMESNILGIAPCSLRDCLFTVQSNGTVSLRVGTYLSTDDRADASFGLEKICSSDTLRHGAQQKVVAFALCPVTQCTLAVLYNSGRIVFWQLASSLSSIAYRHSFVDDFLSFDSSLATKAKEPLCLQQAGFLGALTNLPTCIRMRPMDELSKLENDEFASSQLGTANLAAVGTHAGILHLVDVYGGNIIRDFNVQSSPIKSLEWGGAYLVLTCGYNHSLSTSQVVRNDIYATDIRTGLSRRIRPEADESPISLMRVSFYHCYLALAFQREPLEIWDLKGLRLLRKMSRTCPLIIDMAWSSKHHGVKTTETSNRSVYRENLVVLDSDNRLYHVVVKGLHVKDGKEVNTQWKSGGWTIKNMSWKDDMLAMGDADGRLAVWDLERRQSKHVRASRLPILRMAFSRLAGDHTLAVLHQRELTLWDTEALTRLQTITIDASRAGLDMDLCGSSPILLTSDNFFHFAPTFNRRTPMIDTDIPHLMVPEQMKQMITDFDKGSSDFPLIEEAIKRKLPIDLLSAGDIVDLSSVKNEATLSRYLGDLYAYHLLEIVRFVLEDSNQSLISPDLQMYWPYAAFREREMRVTCAACNSNNVLESRLVERAVVVGGKAKDRVVDRLISSSDLRHASLKAALLVSSQDNEQARSLIKLIATNLIASDMIEDGVELLFLVGSGADACKYLQSQKQWNKSVVYARMGLEDPDEVLTKWVAHLQHDDKSRYVMAQATRSEWPSVVESLSSLGRTRLARVILRTSTSTPPSTERTSPQIERKQVA